jgi:hypothetical protein
MKGISHILLFGALALILLAACTGQDGSLTPTASVVGNTVPGDQTVTPFPAGTDAAITSTAATPALAGTPGVDLTATIPTSTNIEGAAATGAAQTPGVPVTGADLTLLEGQFCIAGMAHALLVLPDTAIFETVADTAALSTPGPDMGCKTVDRYNGRQVVICRGQQNTSLNLNICVDGNNCTPLLVELQSCPQAGAPQPGAAATDTSGAGALTETPAVIPTSTTGVGVTDTPAVVSPTP